MDGMTGNPLFISDFQTGSAMRLYATFNGFLLVGYFFDRLFKCHCHLAECPTYSAFDKVSCANTRGGGSSDINHTCATQNINNKISLHIVRFNIIELGRRLMTWASFHIIRMTG